MTNDLHFISGLPRSGSTLLAALLNQNPRFRAGMSGPVGPLVEAMLKATSMANDSAMFIDDRQREQLLRAVFATFHGDLAAGHVSFDTDRLWCAKLPLIAALFPAARVIACVRNVASIVGSLERLVRANPLQPSGLFGFDPGGTVYSRAEAVGAGSGLVGFAFNALREAFYGPHSDRLLIVTYETLTGDPARALAEIYRFIDHEPFAHDVANIVADHDAFDRRLGTPGLHRIDRRIRPARDNAGLLPPELVARYAADNFWLDDAANPNGVRIV